MAEPTPSQGWRPRPKGRAVQQDSGPAPVQIPRWLDTGAAIAWRLLLVALAIYVLGLVVQRLLVVVIPVALAAMVATVLVPPAHWLRRHGARPAVATWIVFLVGIALITGLFVWLVPTVSGQVTTLQHSAAHGINQVKHWLITGPLHLSRDELQHDIDRLSRDARMHASGFALQGATIALEVAAGLLLTLVTTFFFVKDGKRLARTTMQLFGRQRAAELPELGTLLWRTLTGYVRGTTINGLVNGTVIGIGLYLLGVPLSLPLAVLTFFGAYFPIVGSFLSGAVAALVALAANGPVSALAVVGLTVLIHNLEGYLVGPLVLGRSVELHPLAVLLVIAVGGVIAGIVGAFLAVPTAALVTTTVRFFRQTDLPVTEPPPETVE
jgi:predicted PurR-regulated permease PerM